MTHGGCRSSLLVAFGLLSCAALFPLAAEGTESLSLTAGTVGAYTVPNSQLYQNVQSSRWEFRIHDWTAPAAGTTKIWDFKSVYAQLTSDSRLNIGTWHDPISGGTGNSFYFDLRNRSDVVVRVTRDAENLLFYAELWDTAGGNYTISPKYTMASLGSPDFSGPGALGGQATNCSLAFLRWYNSKLPVASLPPRSGVAGGDLVDWELEGNGFDSSPNGVTLSLSGSVSYTTSPTYPPACDAGQPMSFRAGFPATLDGSRSFSVTGSGSLSYLWQQLGGPSEVAWADRTTAQPVVSELQFGTYEFQLTVTDSDGSSSQCRVKHGAVAADDQERIVLADPNVGTLLGPMTRWGANPWPWFDDRHKRLADFFGALQDSDYIAYWNIAAQGTIDVTAGSTSVLGRDTAFQSTFCGGSSTPAPGTRMVAWYPVAEGSTGRRDFEVAACPDDTHLEIRAAYNASSSATDLHYSVESEVQLGTWINGSTNANYYDNVLAFYSLYYRTGLTSYLNFARQLADRWWTNPYIDEGRASVTHDGNGGRSLAPRLKSFTGLVARALDGRPEMWAGLEVIVEDAIASETRPIAPYDIRENGYGLSVIAIAALLHPQAETRARFVSALESAIANRWGPSQRDQGQWDNMTFGFAPWNGYSGTVSVTNGSTAVAGSGTNWQSGWMPNNFFLVCDVSGENCDAAAYVPSYVSPTSLTLDRPYEGVTADGRGWQISNLVGRGTQPFTLGIVGAAMYWAYQALHEAGSPHAETARHFVLDIADWITEYGYSPTAKGLYYGRNFPPCEPISDTKPNCGASPAEEARFLNSETMAVFSAAYLLTGDAKYRSQGDKLYGAMWGKWGGPETDAVFLRTYDDGGWSMLTKKAKDFGFAFGMGMGSTWPAARMGASESVSTQTITVGFELPPGVDAVGARLTLTRPNGSKRQTMCATSPCSIQTEAGQGDPLLTLEYLDAAGHVLSTTVPTKIAIR